MAIIYEIVNTVNNAKYIGSSMRNKLRFHRHITDLNHNRHHSDYLQRAWNKYGKEKFEFNIIITFEDISQKELFKIEQKYLDDRKLNYPPDLNYNVCWVAQGGSDSQLITSETRDKMSKSHLGIKFSQERKNALIESWTNRSKNTYTLISPTGKVYEFKNIRDFGRQHNLHHTAISSLLNDEIYYYKGWIKDYSHSYSFVSPDNVTYINITNLTEFCNQHELRMKGMSKLHCGKVKSYRGWKKYSQ